MFADPILEKIALRPSWEAIDHNEFPQLGKTDLHVWCVPLELSEKQAELAHAWLSDIQKDKFYRREDTYRYPIFDIYISLCWSDLSTL